MYTKLTDSLSKLEGTHGDKLYLSTELRAMIKKLFRSGLENLPDPSAILRGILREASDHHFNLIL